MRKILLLIICMIGSIAQAQLTEYPSMRKEPKYTELCGVCVCLWR